MTSNIKFKNVLMVIPVAVGLVVGAALSSFTGDTDHHVTLRGHQAQSYAEDVISGRVGGLEIYEVASSYEDYLPNQEFRFGDGTARPLSQAFVTGEVTAVRPGVGYLVEGKDAASGTPTSFGNPDARWRVAVLEVTVAEAAGAASEAENLRIGMTINSGTDFESFRNGLLGRNIAAPLSGQGFYDGASDLWNVSRSDTLLSFVADDGTLALPFLGPEGETGWDLPETVGEVLANANDLSPVIDVETRSGLPVAVS